jgi:ribosome-associated protein
VKKTRSSLAKKRKTGSGKARKAGKVGKPTNKATKNAASRSPSPGGGRKGSERIPVRGARSSGGGKAAGKAAASKGPIRGRALEAEPTAPRSAKAEAELAEARALAVVAMDAAVDKRGVEPVLIDVSGMGSYTDFIGIVSGRSDRQVDAIADHVAQVMKGRGRRVLGQEGQGNGRWTLLDFGSLVIHVFYHPVREFYDLESLWIEAPRVKLDVPPEATLQQPDALYGAL